MDPLKKCQRQVKELLTERSELKQVVEVQKGQLREMIELREKLTQLQRTYKIMEDKYKQVMVDIAKKTEETTNAKQQYNSAKLMLESAQRYVETLKGKISNLSKTVSDKDLLIIENHNLIESLRTRIDADAKIRNRLRKKSEEIESMNHVNIQICKQLEEANQKIKYLESNAKLETTAV
jgi:chromosome segregation ATPase